MTDSALERARREAKECMFCDCTHGDYEECWETIDRLVEAAREEGRAEAHAAKERANWIARTAVEEMVAAARLAGRLEQAEQTHTHGICRCGDISQQVRFLDKDCIEERDRLRREAGK